jgi:CHAT domain-containing protein
MYRFEIGLLLHKKGAVSAFNQLEAFELFQRAQSRTLLDTLGESIHEDSRFDPFPNIVSANAIKQRILDPDSVLVQFYLAEPSSYAWIISQSGFDFVKLPAKKILEQDVRLVLQFDMAGQWTGSQQGAEDRLRRYFAPIFAATQKRRWIVVPDGALHFFPFTVLTSQRKPGHGPDEIVKIPSASVIDMIRRNGNAVSPAYALAIFADPVFDELDSRVAALKTAQPYVNSRSSISRSHDHSRDFLPRLRYTRDEARELTRLFPQDQSRLFLGFEAMLEAAAGRALHDFRIVHLATHSVPDESNPELSRIVFSQVSKDGSPRNGELFAKDIYRMNLSADLVVLSSCQGALGKQQPGEGPMSLARAFLFAGSRAVVASLWEVNDEATAELMQRFYRHMIHDKLPPSTALALAQDEFRHHPDERLRNPYYWAGFELYGEWMEK